NVVAEHLREGFDIAIVHQRSERPSPAEQTTVSKAEFVDRVVVDTGLSKDEAGKVVDSVLASIESALGAGEEANVADFGRFQLSKRGVRTSGDPRTGTSMRTTGSKLPRFIGPAERTTPRSDPKK